MLAPPPPLCQGSHIGWDWQALLIKEGRKWGVGWSREWVIGVPSIGRGGKHKGESGGRLKVNRRGKGKGEYRVRETVMQCHTVFKLLRWLSDRSHPSKTNWRDVGLTWYLDESTPDKLKREWRGMMQDDTWADLTRCKITQNYYKSLVCVLQQNMMSRWCLSGSFKTFFMSCVYKRDCGSNGDCWHYLLQAVVCFWTIHLSQLW